MQVETVKRFDRLTLRRVHFMVWSFAKNAEGWQDSNGCD
jgi:hypothetical protein